VEDVAMDQCRFLAFHSSEKRPPVWRQASLFTY
jgi:hypothetical protein